MKEQKMIEYYRKQMKTAIEYYRKQINSDWILPENKYRME